MSDHVKTLEALARSLERDGQHLTGVSFPEVAVATRAVLEENERLRSKAVQSRIEEFHRLQEENKRLRVQIESLEKEMLHQESRADERFRAASRRRRS